MALQGQQTEKNDRRVWSLHGEPVRIIAIAGNKQGKLFGLEARDADGKLLKLPFNKDGDIPGLVDCDGRPVNRRDFSYEH